MPPKARNRKQTPKAPLEGPSAPLSPRPTSFAEAQASAARLASFSPEFDASSPASRAASAAAFPNAPSAFDMQIQYLIDRFPPSLNRTEENVRRFCGITKTAPQLVEGIIAKLFPPPSPSPALSYASLESTVLKRPRSPGSSSSGSSRAASVVDVDMEFGSRAPTPTPSMKRDIPSAPSAPKADILSPLPLPAKTDILSSSALTLTPAARPPTPVPHVDTPMSHGTPPQQHAAATPSSPDHFTWEDFANAFETVIPEVSNCPDPVIERLHTLITKFQMATVKSRPPKKKVRITPLTPPSALAPAPPPASAPASTAAMSAPAPKKAVAAPPALSKRPDPKVAPPVSTAKPARKRKQGKHTTHGTSRRGIILTPPEGSGINAGSFTPEVINNLNQRLEKDLKSEVILTHHAEGEGNTIFLGANRVPTAPETAFVLKHVRRIFPSSSGSPAFTSEAATSTSFIKIIDVPIVPVIAPSKDWVTNTKANFNHFLTISPIGISLIDVVKHEPRFMRTSPHSETCVVWIDIKDSVSGFNARNFINKVIFISGANCQIRGAKPHSGSVQCTRCMRWGHHASKCRRQGIRCAHCGGPHFTDSHSTMVDASRVDHRHCVNCSSSGRTKRDHSATDRKSCPFWKNRFDRDWLKRQFKPRVNITPQT